MRRPKHSSMLNLSGLCQRRIPSYCLVYVLADFAPERVAQHLSSVRLVADNREYVSHQGSFRGVSLLTVSTGSGASSVATALEELAFAGATTFIRIGACGTTQRRFGLGDFVISTAAVRAEGASSDYAPLGFPALADPQVVSALHQAGKSLGACCHLGTTYCYATMYPGTGRARPKVHLPLARWRDEEEFIEAMNSMRIVSTDMETSIVLLFCSLYNLRGGSICQIVANRSTGVVDLTRSKERLIDAALEAMYVLRRSSRSRNC